MGTRTAWRVVGLTGQTIFEAANTKAMCEYYGLTSNRDKRSNYRLDTLAIDVERRTANAIGRESECLECLT